MKAHLAGPLLVSAALLSSGCYVLAPTHPGAAEAADPSWVREFGYFQAGPVLNSSFFGEFDGVGPGMGVTFTVPPLWPVSYVCTLGLATVAALPVAVIEAEGDGDGDATVGVFAGTYDAVGQKTLSRETLGHGYSDPNRRYISDFSLDLTVSYSSHDDSLAGGRLDYWGVLVGARLGSPRHRPPRWYLTGGIAYFSFDYDNRPDAGVPGPYVGMGLEGFANPSVALTLDVKSHFYFGDDDAGAPVGGGALLVSGLVSFYF